MSDLEELRRKRLEQMMQQQTQQQVHQEFQERELEKQIRLIIGKILTPEANERLGNIRAARSDYARQIEILLIQSYQAGKLQGKITDEQLKDLLIKVSGKKHETKILKR